MSLRSFAAAVLVCALASAPLWAEEAPAPAAAPAAAAAPQPAPAADPAAVALAGKVRDAYQGLDQIQTEQTWTMTQTVKQGDQVQTMPAMEAGVSTSFDRKAGRLRLQMQMRGGRGEGLTLGMQTDKVLVRLSQAKGVHIEKAVQGPPSPEALRQAMPDLTEPVFPVELAFMLAGDPVALLQGQGGKGVTLLTAGEGEAKTQALRIQRPEGVITVQVDAKTSLLSGGTVELSRSMPLGDGSAVQVTMTQQFAVQSRKVNEPIADADLAVDTNGSKAVSSLQELAAAMAQQAEGQRPPHPLSGQAAPDFAVKTVDGKDYKLSADKTQVIVLDFWATWCGPCRRGLPKIQAVSDWAAAEKKSVAVYAVNIGETAEEVKTFWAENKLSLPVLMDADSNVARAYAANAIPQTVVIAGGKVVSVHVGLSPNLEDELKREIESALAAK